MPSNRFQIGRGLVIWVPLLLAADQATKALATAFIRPGDTVFRFWRFGLTHRTNTGFALSIFKDHAWVRPFVISLTLILIPVFFLIYRRFTARLKTGSLAKIAFVLLISGTIGNFLDRLFLGYVRDFIVWPLPGTPNLADLFIDAGIVCILIEWIGNRGPGKA
jgi:signal peptidase II